MTKLTKLSGDNYKNVQSSHDKTGLLKAQSLFGVLMSATSILMMLEVEQLGEWFLGSWFLKKRFLFPVLRKNCGRGQTSLPSIYHVDIQILSLPR